MMLLISASISLGVIICMMMFSIQRHHLLMALLSLEGVILMFVLLIVMYSDFYESYFMFLLLTFGGCEASLGLACLVSITRMQGNDHINLLSILKC